MKDSDGQDITVEKLYVDEITGYLCALL
jgi:hypothetical protein